MKGFFKSSGRAQFHLNSSPYFKRVALRGETAAQAVVLRNFMRRNRRLASCDGHCRVGEVIRIW